MKGKTYDFFCEEAEQYKQILLDYKNTKKVFVDPNFHPTSHIKEREIEIDDSIENWVRIDEICKAPLFDESLIQSDFIQQGELGDCYFLSALSRIAMQPKLVRTLFETKIAASILPKVHNSINIECGAVIVYLHCFGRKTPVLIDTLLPTRYGQLRFSHPSDNTKSAWFCLVEKAYAKLNGSYTEIIGGTLPGAIYNIFGYRMTNKQFNEYSKEKLAKMSLFDRIMKYQSEHGVLASGITLSQNQHGVTEEELQEKGLISGHCYLIKKVRIHDGQKFFCLRNPWGKDLWKGDWCDDSPLWTESLKKALDWTLADDGTFWMNDKDFFRYFTDVEISRPIPPEWYSRRFYVQLVPGDHDGHAVDSIESKMLERPNFAFQINEPIGKDEKCRFDVLVEKRNKLFDEKENKKIDPPLYSVYFAHMNGNKLDPNELPYSARMQVRATSNTFSTHYYVTGNDDIVTIALNRLEKCDLVEDCYVLVYCQKNFVLYDIDKPEECFPDEKNVGYIFSNASRKHRDVAPPLKEGTVKGGNEAIILASLTDSAFDPKRQEDLAKKAVELINKQYGDVSDSDESESDRPKPKSDDDKPKPKSDSDRPKPKSDSDRPKPKSDDDKPKPKSDSDRPKPKSDSDRPKPKSDSDKPKPKSDSDRPKPKSDSDRPKPKSDSDRPKPKSDDDKPKPKSDSDKPKPKSDDDKPKEEEVTDKDELISKIMKENEEMKAKLNQMKDEVNKSKAVSKKLRTRLRKEQEEKEKAQNNYKVLEENSKNTIREKDQEISELKNKIDEMQREQNKLEKAAEEAQNPLKAKDQEISEAKSKIKELQIQLNKMSKEIEEAKNSLKSKDQEITKTNEEKKEMKTQFNKIKKEAEKAKNSLKSKEQEISDSKKEIEELQGQLEKVTNEKNTLQKEIERLKKQKVSEVENHSESESDSTVTNDDDDDDDSISKTNSSKVSENVDLFPDSESSSKSFNLFSSITKSKNDSIVTLYVSESSSESSSESDEIVNPISDTESNKKISKPPSPQIPKPPSPQIIRPPSPQITKPKKPRGNKRKYIPTLTPVISSSSNL